MNGHKDHKRNISAHNLPMGIALPRRTPARDKPAAAFLTQLLATRDAAPLERVRLGNAGNAAASLYRRVETSDVKRVPMGYRKTLSA